MSAAQKITIVNRFDPCRCGCEGSDPQHAKRFVRTIRSTREATEADQARLIRYDGKNHKAGKILRIATVHLPWNHGVEVAEVEFVPGYPDLRYWFVLDSYFSA